MYGLFLDSLFCSTDLFVHIYISTVLNTIVLISLEIGNLDSFNFVLFQEQKKKFILQRSSLEF